MQSHIRSDTKKKQTTLTESERLKKQKQSEISFDFLVPFNYVECDKSILAAKEIIHQSDRVIKESNETNKELSNTDDVILETIRNMTPENKWLQLSRVQKNDTIFANFFMDAAIPNDNDDPQKRAQKNRYLDSIMETKHYKLMIEQQSITERFIKQSSNYVFNDIQIQNPQTQKYIANYIAHVNRQQQLLQQQKWKGRLCNRNLILAAVVIGGITYFAVPSVMTLMLQPTGISIYRLLMLGIIEYPTAVIQIMTIIPDLIGSVRNSIIRNDSGYIKQSLTNSVIKLVVNGILMQSKSYGLLMYFVVELFLNTNTGIISKYVNVNSVYISHEAREDDEAAKKQGQQMEVHKKYKDAVRRYNLLIAQYGTADRIIIERLRAQQGTFGNFSNIAALQARRVWSQKPGWDLITLENAKHALRYVGLSVSIGLYYQLYHGALYNYIYSDYYVMLNEIRESKDVKLNPLSDVYRMAANFKFRVTDIVLRLAVTMLGYSADMLTVLQSTEDSKLAANMIINRFVLLTFIVPLASKLALKSIEFGSKVFWESQRSLQRFLRNHRGPLSNVPANFHAKFIDLIVSVVNHKVMDITILELSNRVIQTGIPFMLQQNAQFAELPEMLLLHNLPRLSRTMMDTLNGKWLSDDLNSKITELCTLNWGPDGASEKISAVFGSKWIDDNVWLLMPSNFNKYDDIKDGDTIYIENMPIEQSESSVSHAEHIPKSSSEHIPKYKVENLENKGVLYLVPIDPNTSQPDYFSALILSEDTIPKDNVYFVKRGPDNEFVKADMKNGITSFKETIAAENTILPENQNVITKEDTVITKDTDLVTETKVSYTTRGQLETKAKAKFSRNDVQANVAYHAVGIGAQLLSHEKQLQQEITERFSSHLRDHAEAVANESNNIVTKIETSQKIVNDLVTNHFGKVNNQDLVDQVYNELLGQNLLFLTGDEVAQAQLIYSSNVRNSEDTIKIIESIFDLSNNVKFAFLETKAKALTWIDIYDEISDTTMNWFTASDEFVTKTLSDSIESDFTKTDPKELVDMWYGKKRELQQNAFDLIHNVREYQSLISNFANDLSERFGSYKPWFVTIGNPKSPELINADLVADNKANVSTAVDLLKSLSDEIINVSESEQLLVTPEQRQQYSLLITEITADIQSKKPELALHKINKLRQIIVDAKYNYKSSVESQRQRILDEEQLALQQNADRHLDGLTTDIVRNVSNIRLLEVAPQIFTVPNESPEDYIHRQNIVAQIGKIELMDYQKKDLTLMETRLSTIIATRKDTSKVDSLLDHEIMMQRLMGDDAYYNQIETLAKYYSYSLEDFLKLTPNQQFAFQELYRTKYEFDQVSNGTRGVAKKIEQLNQRHSVEQLKIDFEMMFYKERKNELITESADINSSRKSRLERDISLEREISLDIPENKIVLNMMKSLLSNKQEQTSGSVVAAIDNKHIEFVKMLNVIKDLPNSNMYYQKISDFFVKRQMWLDVEFLTIASKDIPEQYKISIGDDKYGTVMTETISGKPEESQKEVALQLKLNFINTAKNRGLIHTNTSETLKDISHKLQMLKHVDRTKSKIFEDKTSQLITEFNDMLWSSELAIMADDPQYEGILSGPDFSQEPKSQQEWTLSNESVFLFHEKLTKHLNAMINNDFLDREIFGIESKIQINKSKGKTTTLHETLQSGLLDTLRNTEETNDDIYYIGNTLHNINDLMKYDMFQLSNIKIGLSSSVFDPLEYFATMQMATVNMQLHLNKMALSIESYNRNSLESDHMLNVEMESISDLKEKMAVFYSDLANQRNYQNSESVLAIYQSGFVDILKLYSDCYKQFKNSSSFFEPKDNYLGNLSSAAEKSRFDRSFARPMTLLNEIESALFQHGPKVSEKIEYRNRGKNLTINVQQTIDAVEKTNFLGNDDKQLIISILKNENSFRKHLSETQQFYKLLDLNDILQNVARNPLIVGTNFAPQLKFANATAAVKHLTEVLQEIKSFTEENKIGNIPGNIKYGLSDAKYQSDIHRSSNENINRYTGLPRTYFVTNQTKRKISEALNYSNKHGNPLSNDKQTEQM